jgi:hypothetical protein
MIRRDLDYNKHLEYLDYSNYKMDWDNAWLYCATCTYKDMYDWRMLTLYEFRNDPDIHGWHAASRKNNFPAFVLPVRDRGPAVT